jgi:carboxypeptidase PM20D1
MIFANMWCFGWVIDLLGRLSGGEMNALMRTTVAFTQMQGSSARNVIPTEATMVSNMRLNPSDDVRGALAYLKKVAKDDRVEITALECHEPSPVSEVDCPAWEKVASSVAENWPGCIVSPYLMVQCSDSRHYRDLSNHVYRFSAMALSKEERASIHGNNERIPLETITKAAEFYVRLLKKC